MNPGARTSVVGSSPGSSAITREGRERMLKNDDLEKTLRSWREEKARKQAARPLANDRRTVRVNGQEVVVVTKAKRSVA